MGNLIDLTNQIFGDYKVTGFDNSKGKGKYYWKVIWEIFKKRR